MNIFAYLVLVSALLINVTVKAEGVGEGFTSFAGFELGGVEGSVLGVEGLTLPPF